MKIITRLGTRLVPSLLGWFEQNARDLPWRGISDPYGIWVSEIMLQQTQVKTVLPYWERWMIALPDIAALANARPERLHKLWEGLGYYTRVRNMQKTAQTILERHDGVFPERFEDVIELPGIGRYTAGAICSIAFNQPTPILDGNVIRVLTRIFGIGDNPREKGTNEKLWRIAGELVSEAKRGTRSTQHARRNGDKTSPACSLFNQSLMELGALVCTPRQPRCGLCPVVRHCVACKQHRAHELPNLGKRQRTTARRFIAFVAQKRGRFLIRQRPAGVVNAHFWEFPNIEVTSTTSTKCEPQTIRRQAGRKLFGAVPSILEPLCTIKHSITRYRITMEVFRVRGHPRSRSSRAAGQWLTLQQLRRLPFASAHRKVLQLIGGTSR